MKRAIINGKVYLGRDRFAEAILIEDGVIKSVGSDEEILARAGGCDVYDCGGRTVIPGLNDSHLHLSMVAQRLNQADLRGCRSIDEIVARCRRFIEEHPAAVKNGMIASGWNQDLFPPGEKRYPNRHDVDRISTEIPVVLIRACVHVAAANTKAIEAVGLGPGAPQYKDGFFGVEENGFPSGYFAEGAIYPIQSAVKPPEREEFKAWILRAMEFAASHGLTSVQSNDIGMNPYMGDAEFFRLMHEIYGEGKAPVRYEHQLCFHSPDEFRAYLKGEHKTGKYGGMLTRGPLKLFKDGSLGGRTAVVRGGYLDDPGNYGTETMSNELIDSMVGLAVGNGMQVITHALGDRAIEMVLDSYEKVLTDGENRLRHAVVHYQCLDVPLIERTAQLGVITHVQPIFLNTDPYTVAARFPMEMNRWFLPFKTMHEKGVRMAFGSDGPVEEINPFLGIYCAVTRKDTTGAPEAGFFPEECLDVPLAIDLFTEGSAYAQFLENVKGRIRPGHCADLIVLDDDIFTCDVEKIRDILPVMTMVDGRVAYERELR